MTLITAFLLISLIPMSIVGLLSYWKATDIRYREAMKSLSVATSLKTEFIEHYFEDVSTHLTLQSMLNSNKRFLNLVKRSFETSGMDLPTFVKSDTWEMVTEFDSRDLRAHAIAKNLEDILFINIDGDILYTIRGQEDLGKNVFEDRFSQTLLGKACAKALEKGVMVFSGVGYDSESYGDFASFMVTPINGDGGKKIGLMAFRLPLEEINRIMINGTGLGNTGETYLVGKDLFMRSNSRFIEETTIISMKVDTQAVREWISSLGNPVDLTGENEEDTGLLHEVGIYVNYRGRKVMGMFQNIRVGDVDMAVVAEMAVEEAFASAENLRDIMITIFFLTGIFVVLFSILIAGRIVNPIRILSRWAKNVASGDLTLEEIKTPPNEIGDLNMSFRGVVHSFKEMTEVCDAISRGNFSRTIEMRGESDILGESVARMSENLTSVVMKANLIASGEYSAEITPLSGEDELGVALNRMTETLKRVISENERENWLKTGKTGLNDVIRGNEDLSSLCDEAVKFLSEYLGCTVGSLYVMDGEGILTLKGGYAFSGSGREKTKFKPGEGLPGQVALDGEIKVLEDLPEGHMELSSGLGDWKPRALLLAPLKLNEIVRGVVELASMNKITDTHKEFISVVCESLAISLNSAQAREKMKQLLEETQRQAKELELHKEDLSLKNQELNEQTRSLKLSEERLQAQQEELRQINEELEEQTRALQDAEKNLHAKKDELLKANSTLLERAELLEKQKEEIGKFSEEVEKARQALEEKARDLELSGKYKSEFFANMSHELRTPLNSMIVLSQMLYENKEGTLTDKQIEFAQTVNTASRDLLSLINDVLDLSKVEAGKMEVQQEKLDFKDFAAHMELLFRQVANQKRLSFHVEVSDQLTGHIVTDRQKVGQIVKNLLVNAFKFTEKGGVNLLLSRPGEGDLPEGWGASPRESVAISVSDTGIGINTERQNAIFEAFQQEDGSTSRKFGGTGLGLSISMKLAKLICGNLSMESRKNEGSKFTLLLPDSQGASDHKDSMLEENEVGEETLPVTRRPLLGERYLVDDRKDILDGDEILLFMEADVARGENLLNLGRKMGYKCVIVEDGPGVLYYADYVSPDLILVDMDSPSLNGEEFLRKLREGSSTRDIPVICIKSSEDLGDPPDMRVLEDKIQDLKNGSAHWLKAREQRANEPSMDTNDCFKGKKALLVDDDMRNAFALGSVLEREGMNVLIGKNGKESLAFLEEHEDVDIVLMDIMMPEMDGFEAMGEIRKDERFKDTPIIAITAKAMKGDRDRCIKAGADDYLPKPVDKAKLLSLMKVWMQK